MASAQKLDQVRQKVDATVSAQSSESLSVLLSTLNPSAPPNADPNALDDVITTYTERFDRLQFLFLEQESKEQFFKLVLEQNDTIVDQQAITKAIGEVKEYKANLDERAQMLKNKTQEIKALATKFHENYEQVNGKIDEIKAMQLRLEENKAKLDELTLFMKENENDDPTSEGLAKVKQTCGILDDYSLSSVDGVNKTLEDISKRRGWYESKIKALRSTIDELNEISQRNEQRSTNLTEENARLSALIEELKTKESSLNDAQKDVLGKEDKLSLLIKIWCELYQILDFQALDGKVSFKFKQFPEHQVSLVSQKGQIEQLDCSGVDTEQIIASANKSQTPLYQASTMIYDLLNK
jgi:uncharacterized coiled-coil DUF342 family protein